MVWSCDFTMWHPHGKWCDHVTSPCDIQHESGFRHVGIITGYSSEIDSLRAKILRNHERTNQLVESLQVRLSISRLPVVSHKSFFRVLELSKSQAMKAEKCPDLSRQLVCDPHIELSVCLSVCYLSVSLSAFVCLCVCLSIYLCLCLSACLSVSLSSIYMNDDLYQKNFQSDCLFVCLFVAFIVTVAELTTLSPRSVSGI